MLGRQYCHPGCSGALARVRAAHSVARPRYILPSIPLSNPRVPYRFTSTIKRDIPRYKQSLPWGAPFAIGLALSAGLVWYKATDPVPSLLQPLLIL